MITEAGKQHFWGEWDGEREYMIGKQVPEKL